VRAVSDGNVAHHRTKKTGPRPRFLLRCVDLWERFHRDCGDAIAVFRGGTAPTVCARHSVASIASSFASASSTRPFDTASIRFDRRATSQSVLAHRQGVTLTGNLRGQTWQIAVQKVESHSACQKSCAEGWRASGNRARGVAGLCTCGGTHCPVRPRCREARLRDSSAGPRYG
jgi:hypothetical protein